MTRLELLAALLVERFGADAVVWVEATREQLADDLPPTSRRAYVVVRTDWAQTWPTRGAAMSGVGLVVLASAGVILLAAGAWLIVGVAGKYLQGRDEHRWGDP